MRQLHRYQLLMEWIGPSSTFSILSVTSVRALRPGSCLESGHVAQAQRDDRRILVPTSYTLYNVSDLCGAVVDDDQRVANKPKLSCVRTSSELGHW